MFAITDNLLRETPISILLVFIVVGLIIIIINNAIKKKAFTSKTTTHYIHLIKVIKHLYTKTCKCLA